MNPASLRAAVAELSPRARVALRILIRSPRSVSATDLETIAKAASPEDSEPKAAGAQILAHEIATTTDEYTPFKRDPEKRLWAIDALRDRLMILLHDEPSPTPPLPGAAEDTFHLRRLEFEWALLIAIVDQLRPRVTQTWSVHRADQRALAESLGAVAGPTEEIARRVQEASQLKLIAVDHGRMHIGPDVDRIAESPIAHLLNLRLAQRMEQDVFRVLAGLLLAQQGWVAERTLIETGGVAAMGFLYSNPLTWIRSELAHVARLPGVEVRRGSGPAFWRMSDWARELMSGTPSTIEPSKGGLLVQPNLQVVVSPGAPFASVARLGLIAKLVNADQVAVFALDEATVRRSAAEGWSAQDSLHLLEQSATHGVPSTVARALADWARLAGSARIAIGAVLHTDVPIDDVRRILGSDIPVARLAEGWMRIDAHYAAAAEMKLRKAGVACTPFANLRPAAGHEDNESEDDNAHFDVRKNLLEIGRSLATDARRATRGPKAE